MSRLWLLSLLCLSLGALCFVQLTRARCNFRVDEAKTKRTFQELAQRLSLAVLNGSGKVISTMVHLELVETNDVVISQPVNNGSSASQQLLSTPRIRGFFPETLLRQPELTTDKQSRAQLDFKLADNITTWKMAVRGLTEDGEIGTAETEIRALQPFLPNSIHLEFYRRTTGSHCRLPSEITWTRTERKPLKLAKTFG